MPSEYPPAPPPSPFFQTSPRFGRRPNTSPVSSNEILRSNGTNPSLNECSERDSRRNDIRESFMYLNILDEVIELADMTNNLKLKVINAFRDVNCENCNLSEHGICRAHRYGSGVYNNRSNLVHPVREELMSQISRPDIDSRRAEADEFTDTLINNLCV
tara:strand:- start:1318 stop:1794 length:477 start_codon:yes stop_codon:yes gene_type:complete